MISYPLVLGQKRIPNAFFDLDPLTPPPLPGYPHFGGAGGCQNFFVYCGRCVWIQTQVLNNFFFHMDPLTHGTAGVSGPNSRYPQSATPPTGPCQRGLSHFHAGQIV